MSEILLCNQSLNSQALQRQCAINTDQLSALSCEAPTLAAANTPYLIGVSQLWLKSTPNSKITTLA